MTSLPLGAFVVLLAWWLSTGLILWRVRLADNGGPHAHRASVVYGLPLLAAGAWAATASQQMISAGGVYLGFAAALVLWAWIELAFLSGVITGPNQQPSPSGLPARARLLRAVMAIAWHEAALLAVMIWLIVLQWGALNPMATATFALLLGARSLAKINLFLGVPRINVQFIPRPIAHIASHFRISPASGFFPVSVGILAITVMGLSIGLSTSTQPLQQLGLTLLAALAALAFLEHLFMVLPFPDAKLWAWMLPKSKHTIETLKE